MAGERPNERPDRSTFDRWDGVLLLAAAVFVCWVHLHPFIEDAQPSHFDEWRNAGRMQHFIAHGRLDLPQPTTAFDDLNEDIAHRNLQAGHIVMASLLSRASGLDLVQHHKLLALLGLVVLIGGTYLLSREVATERYAPPLAVLGLALLPTNVNLLGPAYAVPIIPSLGLVCAFLAAWLAENHWSPPWRLAVMVACALALAWIYPLSGLFLFGVLGFAVLLRPAALTSRTRALSWLLLGGILALLAVAHGGSQASGGDSAFGWAISQLVFLDRWHLHRFYDFPLSYMVPTGLLALALGGAWVAWRRRAEVVALALLLPLLDFGFYGRFGYGFGLPFQRLSAYLGTFAAVLGALGAVALAAKLAALAPRWRRSMPPVAIGLSFLVVLATHQAPPWIGGLEHARRPAPAVRETLDWIRHQRFSATTRIHAHPAAAPFIEALTGLRPSDASIDALLNGRGLATFRCDDTYDLVVGVIRCDSYRPIFVSRGVAVYEPQTPSVPTSTAAP